jgi:hypothetical protein
VAAARSAGVSACCARLNKILYCIAVLLYVGSHVSGYAWQQGDAVAASGRVPYAAASTRTADHSERVVGTAPWGGGDSVGPPHGWPHCASLGRRKVRDSTCTSLFSGKPIYSSLYFGLQFATTTSAQVAIYLLRDNSEYFGFFILSRNNAPSWDDSEILGRFRDLGTTSRSWDNFFISG